VTNPSLGGGRGNGPDKQASERAREHRICINKSALIFAPKEGLDIPMGSILQQQGQSAENYIEWQSADCIQGKASQRSYG
jgi:hypothetical protein